MVKCERGIFCCGALVYYYLSVCVGSQRSQRFLLHVRKAAEAEAAGGFRWSMLSFLNGPLCDGDL